MQVAGFFDGGKCESDIGKQFFLTWLSSFAQMFLENWWVCLRLLPTRTHSTFRDLGPLELTTVDAVRQNCTVQLTNRNLFIKPRNGYRNNKIGYFCIKWKNPLLTFLNSLEINVLIYRIRRLHQSYKSSRYKRIQKDRGPFWTYFPFTFSMSFLHHQYDHN